MSNQLIIDTMRKSAIDEVHKYRNMRLSCFVHSQDYVNVVCFQGFSMYHVYNNGNAHLTDWDKLIRTDLFLNVRDFVDLIDEDVYPNMEVPYYKITSFYNNVRPYNAYKYFLNSCDIKTAYFDMEKCAFVNYKYSEIQRTFKYKENAFESIYEEYDIKSFLHDGLLML